MTVVERDDLPRQFVTQNSGRGDIGLLTRTGGQIGPTHSHATDARQCLMRSSLGSWSGSGQPKGAWYFKRRLLSSACFLLPAR